MAFGESYSASIDGGSTVVLRAVEQHELQSLLPAPEAVTRFSDGAGDPGFFLGDTMADELYEDLAQNDEVRGWGIEVDNRIVGITGLCLGNNLEYPGGFTYIVRPEFHGRGIGTCARTIASQDAFRNNHKAVMAAARRDNPSSQRMLEKIGFQCIDSGRGKFSFSHYLLPSDENVQCGLSPDRLILARSVFTQRLVSYSVKLSGDS